jgi:glutamate/tyrosine decarboxylase-like PLP-dependent enzyme
VCDFHTEHRVIAESAHSAYDKAAQYFNIKLWRVPVNKEFQADVKAIRRHINRNTILVITVVDYALIYFVSLAYFCLNP